MSVERARRAEPGPRTAGRHRRQLLFRFVTAAYDRRSPGVASHHFFEDWGRIWPEHTPAVSMLGRLLHHAATVVTNGQSYRMRQASERRGGELPTP